MNLEDSNFVKFSSTGHLAPQEEMLETQRKKSNLVVGLPKETSFQENRIALVPEAVALLVQNGHTVLIGDNAGKEAHFSNHEYSEAGGQIVHDPREVFWADIILKVAPPTLEEIDLMGSRQVLISSLNRTILTSEYCKKLISRRVTGIAYEYIKDKTKSFPLVRAMSEIAGNTSILIAAEYLSHGEYGRGVMFGGFSGISPTEVVILGAGTVGEFAARAAMGMGALVKVFDNSIYKLRRLQNNLNTRIFTSVLQSEALLKSLRSADVAIGAIHSAEGRTQVVVSEEMVREMKQGSVILDISIDQGGCFETSRTTNHTSPVFKKYGVTHYCVPNIASRVPHTASFALSNFFATVLLNAGDAGGIDHLLTTDAGLRKGVYLFNGTLTNKNISEDLGLPFQDMDLLMAAFH